MNRANDIRFVRFLLSPPPDENMITRQRPKKIYLPSEAKEEEFKFGSAKTWDREELDLLGVRFWNHKPLNLEKKILNIKESDWSPEMRERNPGICQTNVKGFEDGVKQLSSVDMDKVRSNELKLSTISKKLAPQFGNMFSSLLDVVAEEEKKKRAKAEKEARQPELQASMTSSAGSSQKRRRLDSPDQSESVKRTRGVDESSAQANIPTTPERLTVASDPNFSRGTVDSSMTVASKDEEFTRVLMNDFLRGAMTVLENGFTDITWAGNNSNNIELVHSYWSHWWVSNFAGKRIQ